MTNNTAILDCFNHTIKFKFDNEEFTINLKEGDLHDSWNAITIGELIFDINFHWEDAKGEKPYLSVYPITDENQTDWKNETKIPITKKLGNRDDYFEESRFSYVFDTKLPMVFRVYDENKNLLLKTKSLNKASDEYAYYKLKNKIAYIIAMSTNFATKRL